MMDKVSEKKDIISITVHDFYCDDCGVYIGRSEEHDDGYYNRLGCVELQMRIDRDLLKLNRCLCNDCTNKLHERAKAMLLQFGFVIE